MNIINDPNATYGSQFGSALGTGLSSGLQMLASLKMQQLQQRLGRDRLVKAGYSPADADLISSYPQAMHTKLFEKLSPAQAVANEVGAVQPQQSPLEQMATQQQVMPSLQDIQMQQPQMPNPYNYFPGLNALQGFMPQQQAQQMQQQEPVMQQTPRMSYGQPTPQQLAKMTTAQRLSMQKPNPIMEQKERIHAENMLQKERHFQQKFGMEEYKTYKPVLEKIAEDKKANEIAMNTYEKMLNLSEKDEINSPEWITGLKMLGLDNIPALLKPGSEEYNSQVVNFFGNIRKYFGARPTEWEVKAYLNKIPTLMNTKEGRRRMVHDLKKIIQAGDIVNDEKISIIKENSGKPPLDLDLLAQERTKGKVDRLWQEFQKGVGGRKFESILDADPKKFVGKGGTDVATGKHYISNGTEWVEG